MTLAQVPDTRSAREWLDVQFAGLPGWVAVIAFTGSRMTTKRFFKTSDLGNAADAVARNAWYSNTYTSCCALKAVPTHGRGTVVDTIGASGLWADLDIAGPGHAWPGDDGTELPTAEDVGLVLDDLGLTPTAVIDSGHGRYCWWFFDEPVVFDSDDERAAFATLSRRFNQTLREHARRRGFHVDSCGDLARVLRPPGSLNRKPGIPAAPVKLIDWKGGRYAASDLVDVLVDPPPPPPVPRAAPRQYRGDGGESPADRIARVLDWADLLEPLGFVHLSSVGGVTHWHHPASTSGPRSTSATTDANGVPVLVVHSESAANVTELPCGGGHRLTKFRIFAHAYHRGDESAAARAIREEIRQ